MSKFLALYLAESTRFKKKKNGMYKKSDKNSGSGLAIKSVFSMGKEGIAYIKEIKKSDPNITEDEYLDMLETSKEYLLDYIKENDIDVLAVPGSDSRVLKDLMSIVPDDVIIFNDIKKSNLDSIHMNLDVIKDEHKASVQKGGDESIKSLRKKGFNEIKMKNVFKQFALLFRGFLEFSEEDSDKLLAIIEDKNVLILDDVISTGASIYETERLIASLNPNSTHALTLFKISAN